jgi:outer membrane protein assembly factor BamA
MRVKYVLLVLLFCSLSVQAQVKLIRKLLSEKVDSTRKASFMPVPVFGYSQETGFQFGVGALYSFYADSADTLNRSSNFSETLSYSTKKTYNLSIYGDAWSKGNLYHTIFETRFRRMPLSFYGIGNRTRRADEVRLEESEIKLLFEQEREVLKNTYSGVSLGFERYGFKDLGPMLGPNPAMQGSKGGKVMFFGLSQSYDTRNSNNYPTKGFYGRLTYQYAPDFYGRDGFTGNRVTVNLRDFIGLSNKLVLGSQAIFQTLMSNHLPFYILPQLGSDEMMRGYYTGRYRDQNLLALQAELRYRYTSRLGAVLFLGSGTVWGRRNFGWTRVKPDIGAGLRYFYDPAKGLSTRIDYGIGEKRPNEPRQGGLYVSLAEAF